jgi:hypothetical protein
MRKVLQYGKYRIYLSKPHKVAMDQHTSLLTQWSVTRKKSFVKLTLGFQKYINLPGMKVMKHGTLKGKVSLYCGPPV